MKKNKVFEISFLLIVLSALSFAQTNLVDQIKNKYSSVGTFQADFSVETGQRLSGRVVFQKENKIKIVTEKRTIVSDGKTNWNYEKRTNKVIISEAAPGQSQFSPEFYLSQLSSGKDFQTLEKKNGLSGVKFTPQNNGMNLKSIVLWVDSNLIVKRIEAERKHGGKFVLSLKNVKLNQPVAADEFKFQPPENARIIDLR
ncbi:MAG: hypothetical protein GXO87_07125 [Chlorobi bacterium]|nr:hypothetical protein [Chlorobiota bacterium]